jgi:hypothetical protein
MCTCIYIYILLLLLIWIHQITTPLMQHPSITKVWYIQKPPLQVISFTFLSFTSSFCYIQVFWNISKFLWWSWTWFLMPRPHEGSVEDVSELPSTAIIRIKLKRMAPWTSETSAIILHFHFLRRPPKVDRRQSLKYVVTIFLKENLSQ